MILAAMLGFGAACLMSMVLTILVRRFSPRIGLVDRPDDRRKLHEAPIALGGGLAVFVATSTVLAATLVVPNPWNLVLKDDWRDALGFFLAAGSIVILGLVDDRFGLRGRHKLLGQVVAASILVAGGLVIRRLGLFGWEIELGWLGVPATIFWLVGATNAINLLDGIDGLATMLGILLSLTLAAMAFITFHPAVAVVALVFAGSLVGFLRFNFPPATIFLGDCGSMLIGLMVGALAIRSSLKGAGTILLAAPLATLTLPILDSAAAIVRRRLTGRSIYSTDRAHLHHRLLQALGSNRRVLAAVALACAFTSAGALASASTKNDLIAIISAAGVIAVFAITGLFGRGEILLLAGRARRAAASLARPITPNVREGVQTSVRLQGNGDWDLLWGNLIGAAEQMRLDRVHLDVHLPMLQESYNATWDAPATDHEDERWQLDFPLIVGGHGVGRLTIVGNCADEDSGRHIDQLRQLLEPVESQLRLMTEARRGQSGAPAEAGLAAATATMLRPAQGKNGKGYHQTGGEHATSALTHQKPR